MPFWYVYAADASSVRLLTDDGEPSPELSTDPACTLAELTAASHAAPPQSQTQYRYQPELVFDIMKPPDPPKRPIRFATPEDKGSKEALKSARGRA
ncbi:MAG TPA: hypothetical protein VLI72_14130 [Methylibium sp.]|nr:hypothetical protein [Methylibium sp.]